MNGENLKEKRKRLKLTQTQLATQLEVSLRTIQNWEKNVNNIPKAVELYFLNNEKKEKSAKYAHLELKTKSNGRLINKTHKKLVTKIPAKSQLGLQGTSYKEDYIGHLEQYEIVTEDHEFGRYFEIECIGDSMDSGDPRTAILDGDEIRVREISRDLYINNQLHFNEWPEFTFFHYTKDIITKHVLDHDVPGRRVLINSYNPNKEDYPDEWISLNDCYIVCNVIEIKRPRGIKKRLKKLAGNK